MYELQHKKHFSLFFCWLFWVWQVEGWKDFIIYLPGSFQLDSLHTRDSNFRSEFWTACLKKGKEHDHRSTFRPLFISSFVDAYSIEVTKTEEWPRSIRRSHHLPFREFWFSTWIYQKSAWTAKLSAKALPFKNLVSRFYTIIGTNDGPPNLQTAKRDRWPFRVQEPNLAWLKKLCNSWVYVQHCIVCLLL